MYGKCWFLCVRAHEPCYISLTFRGQETDRVAEVTQVPYPALWLTPNKTRGNQGSGKVAWRAVLDTGCHGSWLGELSCSPHPSASRAPLEASAWFPWTSPVCFPSSADFELFPFSVIYHKWEYKAFLSSQSPSPESGSLRLVLTASNREI